MGKYGDAAIKATKLYCDRSVPSPNSAWEKAVREVFESTSSQQKGCPRCAYLGLCEEGEVFGCSKARSKAAKKRGLPEKLAQYLEARRQRKVAASTKAATKTEAGAASKPKRTRLKKKAI